jgi:1-acyl-sn-glycerol-3-phosphate acyltransferase
MEIKTIYYKDELNDEFSEAKIIPRVIDENYKYVHTNIFWKIVSCIVNFVLFFVKRIYPKVKFQNEYIGKEKLKDFKNTGYFVYVNHTQPIADTCIPSVPIWPKKNFFIVNPENVSMKGLSTIAQMAGAIPIPANKKAMKNFLSTIKKRINENAVITIYPEAHIWPYYTKIRNFKSVSFKYPIELNKPVFCMTNTYQKNSKGKPKIVTYIDGPFFPDDNLTLQEKKHNLRDKVYNCMMERSKNSNIEYIKYIFKK